VKVTREAANGRVRQELVARGKESSGAPGASAEGVLKRLWRFSIMEALVNFFALRPTFTFLGLRIVWYIYLFNTLVQTYIAVSTIFRALAQRGISWEAWSPNFIPLILGLVVQLALVRIFLEVAAIIISNWQSRS
jgi:hypothetical protein